MTFTDNNPDTYWATNDGRIQASLIIDLKQPTAFNRILIQEYIQLGQRVKKFTVEALVKDKWESIADETTVGYKRILRLPTVTASQVRFTVSLEEHPDYKNYLYYPNPSKIVVNLLQLMFMYILAIKNKRL